MAAKFDEKIRRRIRAGLALPAVFLIILLGLVVLRAASLMFGPEGEGWKKVMEKENLHDSSIVIPQRGNIYSCDGVLIASSVQKHKLLMDFKSDAFDNDLFNKNIDSLCICVAKLYGNIHTPEYYKAKALEAKKNKRRAFVFEPKFVSHSDYKRAVKFPFWRERSKKTNASKAGFYVETQIERKKTFGNQAGRTIGNYDPEADKGRNGIEKRFDEELRGETGIAIKGFHGKGRPMWTNIVDPVDGADVFTTLDMRMQDVVTSALADVMQAASADSGCAMLMDVHTGEIKALSNLTLTGTSYVDQKNYAVGMNSEPGSVFKLASVIALLEEAKIDTSYQIETGDGFWKEKGMHDHNWKADGSGGFGTISLAHAFHVSSNIGIAKPVNEYFGQSKDRKDRYVNKLYSMKLADRMDLDIPNDVRPRIRKFDDPEVKNDGTYLTSMSIGYSVQIPPIYTLAFYNAIANDGKMVKPMFVKSVKRDGSTLKSFQTEVVCSSVCNNKTLGKVREMLKGVIEQGTGKKAKSDILELAGKSGTARMHYNNASGTPRDYQMSFVGYFPADRPRYTCMVVYWQKAYLYNNITSKAFKTIAERIYAMTPVSCETALCDNGKFGPEIKGGYKSDVECLLRELNVRYKKNKIDDDDLVTTVTNDSVVSMTPLKVGKFTVPKVIGLGAKDALYLLENKGLKVTMHGRGTVVQQSIPPGTTASPGGLITITLK